MVINHILNGMILQVGVKGLSPEMNLGLIELMACRKHPFVVFLSRLVPKIKFLNKKSHLKKKHMAGRHELFCLRKTPDIFVP